MQDKSKKKSGAARGDKNEPDQSPEAEASLRDAREALGINVDEVAHDLHLSREVVLALEAGDYEALGAPVFVRGHLRSYARLIGLSEDKIMAGYQPYVPEPEEFRTLSAHTVVKPGASLPNFVLWGLLVLVLLVGLGYLLLGDEEPAGSLSGIDDQSADFSEPRLIEKAEPVAELTDADPATDSDVTSTEDDSAAAAAADSPVDESSAAKAIQEPVLEVKQEPSVREEPEVVEQPPVAEVASVSLILRFSEECWVEISDSKRRLLYGLEKPGVEVELEGTPPFKLFIGDVGAVEIEIAGRPFTVPPSGLRGGNTARFSIAQESFL